MNDPASTPERRYNPRDEKVVFTEVQGKGHVKILHKPTGITVEATGDDIDLETLKADLRSQVEARYESVGRILDSVGLESGDDT